MLKSNIEFSRFEVFTKAISPLEKEFLIKFFYELEVSVEDITNIEHKNNHQKVVQVKYKFQSNEFTTKPLYYKNIRFESNVKDADSLLKYFDDDVFWLDIDVHGWPQPKGKTDIDSLIIDDITDDAEFKRYLRLIGNNLSLGYLQRITKEGRSNQYFRNLENNNHWHDLIILIKEYIKTNGEEIDKKYFKPLVFKWDGDKNTDRLRSTLSPDFGDRLLIVKLKENIKAYTPNIVKLKESMEPIINLLRYKKQIILQGPPGTGKTKLAKEIAKELIGGDISIKKIPETIDQNIIVEKALAGTKILSARDSVEYYIVRSSDKGVEIKVSSGSIYIPKYQEIIDSYTKRVWEKEGNLKGGNDSYSAAVAKYIYKLFAEEYRRNYANQIKILQFHPSYTYEDFVRGIVSKPNIDGNGIVYEAEDKTLGEFAKAALENYLESLDKQIISSETEALLKNYILIIDEINRANLSAVLGELIYALEYRGEPVESMYAIDGDNKLILPPNLYIIGTMNTADRSVGHIDYAIRRRFAFVDVLPKDLSQEVGVKFDSILFNSVSQLFDTNLSPEFDKKDVQLGHSYFIDKTEDGGSMDIRLEYEIAPILFEYVKDGILIGDDIKQKIEDLRPSV